MKPIRVLALAALLLLPGCASQLYPSLPDYMQSKKLSMPDAKSFPHCQNYGCKVVKNVSLSKADWNKIEKTFGSKAKNAAQEREKTTKTIGVFEEVVGLITHTEHDREGTFIQTGDGQLDCVDESTNTTIYMMMLKQRGLMRFHEIEQPQVRYPIISGRGWMHQTAVITQKDNGAQFAIDSWYEDNGVPAYVVPLEEWLNGWHPRPD